MKIHHESNYEYKYRNKSSNQVSNNLCVLCASAVKGF